MKTEKGLLKELKGTLSLEGLEVSGDRLEAFAAEHEEAKRQGAVSHLIEKAKARFPEPARPEPVDLTTLRQNIDALTHQLGDALVPLSTHQQLIMEKWKDPEFRASLDAALAEGVKRIARLIKQIRLLACERPSSTPFLLQPLIEEAFLEAGKAQAVNSAQLKCEAASRSAMLNGNREALKDALVEVMRCGLSSYQPEPTIVRLNGTSLEIDMPTCQTEASDSVCALAFGDNRHTQSNPSLSLSTTVIEMHKGTVEIDSPKSGHAGFIRISLPVNPIAGRKV